MSHFCKKVVPIFCLCLMIGKMGATEKLIDRGAPSLELSAKLQNAGNADYVIAFELQNIGKDNIPIYTDYLPWRTKNALTLVAIPLNHRDAPLQAISAIEDPTIAISTLKPGDVMKGSIHLRDAIRGLKESLLRGDMAIFWAVDAGDLTMNGKYARWSGTFILTTSTETGHQN